MKRKTKRERIIDGHVVTFFLSHELYEQLYDLSIDLDSSMAHICRRLVKEHLESLEK